MNEKAKNSLKMQFPLRFIALLGLDVAGILIAATLVLRGIWLGGIGVAAGLFLANAFFIPSALRVQGTKSQLSNKGASKIRFLGIAMLVVAVVRAGLFLQSGFSWPSLGGVISGALLGTLFLFLAKKVR